MAEGGYKWSILIAAFFVVFLIDGCIFAFGMLLIEFLSEFQDTRAATTIIGSLVVGVMNLAGPLAGLLTDIFGCRAVVMMGAVISFGGFLGATFASSLNTLSVCYGFLGGLGFGLMYLPTTSCVVQHFAEKRALAVGIALCGSGVGTFTTSLLMRYLIDVYTWRGAILVLAGMVLHGIPSGLLLVPKRKAKQMLIIDAECKDVESDSRQCSRLNFMQCKNVIMVNVRLLADLRCVCFLLSTFVSSFSFMIPFALLPDQAVHVGMTKFQASWLVSAIGISNTISRVVLGWLADRKCVNRMLLLEILILFAGISTAISPLLSSFEAKLAYSCVFGFLIGGYVTLVPVVLADMFGSKLIEKSFGLNMLAIAIPDMVALPIGGWIFDRTGSYNITFIVAGCEFVISGLILAIPWCFQRLRRTKDFNIGSTS